MFDIEKGISKPFFDILSFDFIFKFLAIYHYQTLYFRLSATNNNQQNKRILLQNFSMPFIFHSQKLSIFEPKPQNLKSLENQLLQSQLDHQRKNTSPINKTTTLSKRNPFLKLKNQNYQPSDYPSQSFTDWNQPLTTMQRPFKKYADKPSKLYHIDHKNKAKSNQQNTLNLSHLPIVGTQGSRIHKPTSLPKKNQTKKYKISKDFCQQSYLNDQRLKYAIDENPGPGSYKVPIVKNQKSTVCYQSPSYNYSLPQQKRSSLESFLLSIQQKIPKSEVKSFLSDCNYKNQNYPSFKPSILNQSHPKKNEALLNLLFSKKNSENKSNHSETTCQSRMVGTPNNQIYEDGFQRNEQKYPGPFQYDPNIECNQENKDKKTKPFLSGEPKSLSYIHKENTPGPGTYLETMVQKKYVLDQNLSKRPNKFEQYGEVSDNICGFSSGVPRQLHFDTQNLCRQELYYSPKNNLSDLIEMKIDKGNRSNKSQFGSSLQRFPKDQIMEQDPYKYCFSKVMYSPVHLNCPSLNFTEKRQIFKPISNTVSPNQYNDNTNTIQKQTEKQLFRKLLQSKYQDEVALLKEKKRNMESVLIEQNKKSVNIKSTSRESQELNPDSYQQYMANKKMFEKENISFGYKKGSKIDRTTQARKQLDKYYETEQKWDIRSFNKEYGYEVEER